MAKCRCRCVRLPAGQVTTGGFAKGWYLYAEKQHVIGQCARFGVYNDSAPNGFCLQMLRERGLPGTSPNPDETRRTRWGTLIIMNTRSRTFRWIAAALSAVLLISPLAPTLAHACSGMTDVSGSPAAHGHAASSQHAPSVEHTSGHEHSAEGHSSEQPPVAVPPALVDGSMMDGSSGSHHCNGPCAGSDCCSMRAAPVPQSDVVLVDRVQPVTASPTFRPVRARLLYPVADRAPPPPAQPNLFPSLLSARLHVWTATFLT